MNGVVLGVLPFLDNLGDDLESFLELLGLDLFLGGAPNVSGDFVHLIVNDLIEVGTGNFD